MAKIIREDQFMSALQNDQKQVTSHSKDSPVAISVVDLMSMAKPIGTFAGSKDSILRFRSGELVAADTGEQGAGQN
jgi:hypothetical protein